MGITIISPFSQTHLQEVTKMNSVAQFGFFSLVEICLVSLSGHGKSDENHSNMKNVAPIEKISFLLDS